MGETKSSSWRLRNGFLLFQKRHKSPSHIKKLIGQNEKRPRKTPSFERNTNDQKYSRNGVEPQRVLIRKPKTHSTERALRAEIRRLQKKQKERIFEKALIHGLRILGVKDFIKQLEITKGMRKRALEKFLAMNREAIESFAIYEDVPISQIYDQIFGY